MQINFSFLPGAMVGDVIKVGDGCFGATIALRRDVLDRIGGFARLRDELADDHRIGEAVRRLGLKTVLSPYIVENRVTETSLAGSVAARAALGAHRAADGARRLCRFGRRRIR